MGSIDSEKMEAKRRAQKVQDADVDNADGEGDLANIVSADPKNLEHAVAMGQLYEDSEDEADYDK